MSREEVKEVNNRMRNVIEMLGKVGEEVNKLQGKTDQLSTPLCSGRDWPAWEEVDSDLIEIGIKIEEVLELLDRAYENLPKYSPHA